MLAAVAGACAAPATPAPSPSPTVTATPAALLTRDQAIAAARAATPQRATDGVVAAELRHFADVVDQYAPIAGGRPASDAMVWVVNLGWRGGPLNAQGTVILVDASDGHIIQSVDWIS